MDTKIMFKLESQNTSESFTKDFAVKNNDAIIQNDCEMVIKTEIKEEAPVTDCSSQDDRKLCAEGLVKIYALSNSSGMEIDTKADIASDKRQLFHENLIKKMKEFSSDYKVEIKEEPWWLERTLSDSEKNKDGKNEADLTRLNTEIVSQALVLTRGAIVGKDINLNARQHYSELKETIKNYSNIKKAFTIEEALCSEDTDQHNDKIITASTKQNISCHETVNIHKCQVCERIFTQMTDLKQHNLIHAAKKLHKCKICLKTFTLLSSLKRHALIHEGIKPHKCELCNKSFNQISHLKRHNMIHEGVKPHKCYICEKNFSHLSSFKRHNLIHKGIKPHKCKICESTFTVIGDLKLHNLIHEGVKPHVCEICDKTFTRKTHLKRHILTHQHKKPHKCGVCEKSFTRLSTLKQHNLIHKGVKSHQCGICKKTFSRLLYLKQHYLIHEGVQTYKCELCGKNLRHLSALKRHILGHEKKNVH